MFLPVFLQLKQVGPSEIKHSETVIAVVKIAIGTRLC